jgi:hypothetical protein
VSPVRLDDHLYLLVIRKFPRNNKKFHARLLRRLVVLLVVALPAGSYNVQEGVFAATALRKYVILCASSYRQRLTAVRATETLADTDVALRGKRETRPSTTQLYVSLEDCHSRNHVLGPFRTKRRVVQLKRLYLVLTQ